MFKAWICSAMFAASFALFGFALSVQQDRFTWTSYRDPLIWDAPPIVIWIPTIEALEPDPAESETAEVSREIESVIYLPEVQISARRAQSGTARARGPLHTTPYVQPYVQQVSDVCPPNQEKKTTSGLLTICG
ncbi:MAG TPA: hypothetical protein VFQ61_19030 [Polyangiaceae bacterium]|nr:hypothetical protein [Polyangiaceae bacterium]